LVRDILRFNDRGERVCLVTFNYDLLLDSALYSFGFKPRAPEEHLDSHPILKLFKLHGSVDWCRLVDLPDGTRLSPQGLIETADTIRLTDTFVRGIAVEPTMMFTYGKPISPAIAIPVQTKTEHYFECPITHRTYLAEMLPNITKILIVGWQAREAHFLGMLRSNVPRLRHVMVVARNAPEAEAILRYFVHQIGISISTDNVFVARGGFTDFIVNHEGHEFFSAWKVDANTLSQRNFLRPTS
jgi:hypothetical protein